MFRRTIKKSRRLRVIENTVYIIIILATNMEVLATPAPPRPQRSLSYNDLKRRRLQRSTSNKKMTIQQGPSTTQSKRRHLT